MGCQRKCQRTHWVMRIFITANYSQTDAPTHTRHLIYTWVHAHMQHEHTAMWCLFVILSFNTIHHLHPFSFSPSCSWSRRWRQMLQLSLTSLKTCSPISLTSVGPGWMQLFQLSVTFWATLHLVSSPWGKVDVTLPHCVTFIQKESHI